MDGSFTIGWEVDCVDSAAEGPVRVSLSRKRTSRLVCTEGTKVLRLNLARDSGFLGICGFTGGEIIRDEAVW